MSFQEKQEQGCIYNFFTCSNLKRCKNAKDSKKKKKKKKKEKRLE